MDRGRVRHAGDDGLLFYDCGKNLSLSSSNCRALGSQKLTQLLLNIKRVKNVGIKDNLIKLKLKRTGNGHGK